MHLGLSLMLAFLYTDLYPRRLVEGGWEKSVFIGELLWLGRKQGIIDDALVGGGSESEIYYSFNAAASRTFQCGTVVHHKRTALPARYLSTRSTASMSMQTDLSTHNSSYIQSTSTTDSVLSDRIEAQPMHNTRAHRQLQCIHELKDPSHILEGATSYSSRVDDSMEEFDPDHFTQSSSSIEQPPIPTPQPV